MDRTAEPVPSVLRRRTGSLADRDWEAGLKMMEGDPAEFRQRGGPQFKAYRHPSVKEALHRLFHGKCAYCESRIGATQPGDIDQFRPKGGVLAADGALLPLHYWWLANEWSNLYLSCAECNRIGKRLVGNEFAKSGKGGRFPLEEEAQRADVLGDHQGERPLLLDPCQDQVEDHLVFSADGLVSSRTERGQTTIDILGLNRIGLVEARRRGAQQALHMLDTLRGRIAFQQMGHLDDFISQLREMMKRESEYAGMFRQIIWARLGEDPATADFFRESDGAGTAKTRNEERLAKAAMAARRRRQEDYSLEDGPSGIAAYVNAVDRRVQRIAVRNLRAIGRLDIGGVDHGGRAPWLMLLGENASGKSTVLQAVALALIGEKYREKLVGNLSLDLGRMVRSGAPFGEISVTLSGGSEPRTLRIFPNGRLETTGRAAQLMVLGYGSTRLLPRGEPTGHFGEPYARIENLFDPFIPLVDAEEWLLSCSNPEFDYAATAIKAALGLGVDRMLVRRNDQVGLMENGALISLGRLCDGYQTVIALIADILAVVLRAWSKPELAQGLVLIDEVGNHLHPSWKIRFVESMRDILPGVQVLATTHEPLCLRGLRDGEVAVLRRGPRGGIHLIEDLPSIEGMRIDQILTSEHFGLQSTLDPQLQADFDRYHQLLRLNAPTPIEAEEIEAIRGRINTVQKLGNSERERRLLDAIDRFMARRVEATDPAERSDREARLERELAEIWMAGTARQQ